VITTETPVLLAPLSKGFAKEMPVLSKYAKQRIVALKGSGLKHGNVVYAFGRENITTSRQTVRRFYLHYLEDATINQRPGSGRPLNLAELSLAMVEQLMWQDDETSATQIHLFLVCNGVDVSLTTILRGRRTLGWTFRGSAYCQLIWEANKHKHLEWAQLHLNDNFHDVVGLMNQLFSCNHTSDIAALKQASHPV